VYLTDYEVEEQHDVWTFRYSLSDDIATAIKEGESCDLRHTKIVLVPKCLINFRCLPDQCIRNKRFLEKQIRCDFSLIAANGVKLPCHKLFLEGCFGIPSVS